MALPDWLERQVAKASKSAGTRIRGVTGIIRDSYRTYEEAVAARDRGRYGYEAVTIESPLPDKHVVVWQALPKILEQYKTVFTIVVYNYGDDATEAENKSIKWFENLVGKQKAQQFMETNYPITSVVEVEGI